MPQNVQRLEKARLGGSEYRRGQANGPRNGSGLNW